MWPHGIVSGCSCGRGFGCDDRRARVSFPHRTPRRAPSTEQREPREQPKPEATRSNPKRTRTRSWATRRPWSEPFDCGRSAETYRPQSKANNSIALSAGEIDKKRDSALISSCITRLVGLKRATQVAASRDLHNCQSALASRTRRFMLASRESRRPTNCAALHRSRPPSGAHHAEWLRAAARVGCTQRQTGPISRLAV